MKEKASKKASTKVIETVQNIDPTRSKLTTYDEAWEVISKAWGLTGDIKTTKDSTTFLLTVDQDTNNPIHKFEWENSEVFEDGDWNWTTIFSEVLKYVIKNKLNNPKNIKKLTKQYVDEAAAVCLKNTAKKLENKKENKKDDKKEDKRTTEKPSKTTQISKIDSKVNKTSDDTKNSVKSRENIVKIDSNRLSTIEGLKKEKMRLYMKIRSYTRKGKDTKDIESEYKKVVELIKNFKSK